jgi:hypothetical protein
VALLQRRRDPREHRGDLSAVSADIIVKLVRLADEGDAGAQVFRNAVTDAQDKGLTSGGVSAMQKIEASLVDKAVEFELIDTSASANWTASARIATSARTRLCAWRARSTTRARKPPAGTWPSRCLRC